MWRGELSSKSCLLLLLFLCFFITFSLFLSFVACASIFFSSDVFFCFFSSSCFCLLLLSSLPFFPLSFSSHRAACHAKTACAHRRPYLVLRCFFSPSFNLHMNPFIRSTAVFLAFFSFFFDAMCCTSLRSRAPPPRHRHRHRHGCHRLILPRPHRPRLGRALLPYLPIPFLQPVNLPLPHPPA